MRHSTIASLLLPALLPPPPAAAHDFEVGDVICGVGTGNWKVYTNSGGYIETIFDGLGGPTAGCYFLIDPADPPGRLYGTDFGWGEVVVVDGADGHAILDSIDTGDEGDWLCESVCFDEVNDIFYVGHIGGAQDVQVYDFTNAFVGAFDVPIGPAGSDWLELGCDLTTLYYSSEGYGVRRYDLATSTPLPDFATGLSDEAYGICLLPPFDGASGMLVANRKRIVRLDGGGAVVQVYDAAGEDFWFTACLDPNGTSFWAADIGTAHFYRFDLASGAVEVGPIDTGTGYGTLTGLTVVGRPTGSSNEPPIFEQAQCDESWNMAAGGNYGWVVSCVDPDPGDSITLTAAGVPVGATHTPALPLFGAPDEDLAPVFDWTPSAADLGAYTVLYNLIDEKGASADCQVDINVFEGFLVVGSGLGGDPFTGGGHVWTTQLAQIRESHVATNEVSPLFDVPPLRHARFGAGPFGSGGTPGQIGSTVHYYQALMYDPGRFPTDAERSSNVLAVEVFDNGILRSDSLGSRDGMEVRLESFLGPDRRYYYRIRIAVDGL